MARAGPGSSSGMHPRARRVTADAEQMRTEFAGHPEIQVEAVGWEPPEQYRVTFDLAGVKPDERSGQPVVAEHHQALINLPAAHPREKPYCTMETPVFHPNFGGAADRRVMQMPQIGDRDWLGWPQGHLGNDDELDRGGGARLMGAGAEAAVSVFILVALVVQWCWDVPELSRLVPERVRISLRRAGFGR